MKKIFLLSCWLLAINFARADKPEYSVDLIPSHLLENSVAVVRLNAQHYQVLDKGKAIETQVYVITILKRKASALATFGVSYDKLIKIKKLEGRAYDRMGKEIRRFKNSDIKDESSISSFSLFEDNRVQYIDYTPPVYPITLEFEVERMHHGVHTYPDFQPINYATVAVENASMTCSVPDDIQLQYKAMHFASPPDVSRNQSTTTYQWEIKDWPAVEEWDNLRPSYHRQSPVVLIAPDHFEYDGSVGSMKSWKSMGMWINGLADGRDELPAATVDKVRQLTAGLSDRDKILKLYNYLQQKTRYVSVQLGIGGFQPFPATMVDEVGYGDCKALSNYMKALLKAADVPSYLTLINHGKDHREIVEDFPELQFNHMILCVPVAQDTMWLECTSQNYPAGYIGANNSNRTVLVVNDEGGFLVKTTRFGSTDNFQSRKVKVNLDSEGNAKADVLTHYGGYQMSRPIQLSQLAFEDQTKQIYESLDMQGVVIEKVAIDVEKAKEELRFSAVKYAKVSGSRVFFQPNFMNRLDFGLAKKAKRTCDIRINYPFRDVDTVVFILPAGYYTEYIPEKIEMKSEFGYYSSSFEQEDTGKITYIRIIERYSGLYPAEKYDEFQQFFSEISEHDEIKVVLKNST